MRSVEPSRQSARTASSLVMLATLAVVVVFAGIMISATGTTPRTDLPAANASSDRRVAVFGDSLTDYASNELVDAFDDPGVDGEISGVSGARVRDAFGPVVRALEDGPDAVVVALGVNDILFSGAPWLTMRSDVDMMVRTVSDVECVVWVAPAVQGANDEVDRMSDYLHSLESDRVHVVDWGKVAAAEEGIYVEDGVHHTEVGQRRFAEVVRGAVRDDCGI